MHIMHTIDQGSVSASLEGLPIILLTLQWDTSTPTYGVVHWSSYALPATP